MKTNDFFKALQTTLETGTGRDWGLQEPPSDTPAVPYGVIQGLRGRQPVGSLGRLVDWMELRVQLVSVGKTYEQAAWMQQKTLDTIIGDSRLAIQSGGETVSWVELEEAGRIADSGHSLWQSDDIFLFRINFG